jgi:phospholipase/carboxylesterase
MTNMPLPPLIEDLSLAYRFRAAQGKPAGLLVLLHGVGSNETSLAGLADSIPGQVAVALARSPLALGPAAFAAFAVNFTANGPVIDAVAAETSRQTLEKFVEELQQRTQLPAERTLVAGFSQGGIMSASLALTSPESVAGFAILSGRILPEITGLTASPARLAHLEALILHGEDDNTLSVSWAERSAKLLDELGVSFQSRRYPARHEITRDMAQDFSTWVTGVLPPA